jgi:acyl dehydratase
MLESKVEFPDGRLTEELLAEARKLIGTQFRIGHSINNEQATRIAILKFAEGIGDTNPLWADEEYAAKTRYGSVIAPPSWVFSVFSGIQCSFRGVGGFHSGSTIEFYRPIYRNDAVMPEMVCTAIEGPKKSAFAEKR